MVSVKVIIYRQKTLKNGEHPLLLRISKNRKSKYVAIGHSCFPDFFDKKSKNLTKKYPNRDKILRKINEIEAKAISIILDYENEKIDFSLDQFVKKFKDEKRKVSVDDYFGEWINKYRELGRIGNARIYSDTQKALQRFLNNKSVNFSEINVKFINRFVDYYLLRGVKPNSISVYLRTLRALFNKAIDDDIVKREFYPFEKYKISKLNRPTIKRAISKDDIKKIINLTLEEETSLWHSRNYFLFSFYNMGMNFMDIALLRSENINNGLMRYERAKTGKQYTIGLLPPAVEILDYYKIYNAENDYIFPLLNPEIHKTPQSINNRIQRCRKITNSDLKIIARMAGLESNLTTYVARHSWATILKRSGISTSIISEGLGHTTEKTTQVYLDSFERETLDNANKKALL